MLRLSLTALCAAALAACGGGGGGSDSGGSNQPAAPKLAALVTLEDGAAVGRASFASGATATGGQGQVVQGLSCVKPPKFDQVYNYSHLNLVVDGQAIAIPDNIGLVSPGNPAVADAALRLIGCAYPLITTDSSGKIRTEADIATPFTLGQFFALWGQPLSTSNVAGYAGKPVKVFVKDGSTLTEYTGALEALALTVNREITIQVGTPLAEIPQYSWIEPPPLSTVPTVVRKNVFGDALNGVRRLEDNTTNGKGGQGQVVDGYTCYGQRNNNGTLRDIYHAHTHLAIYNNGERLAIPQQIGIVSANNFSTSCFYPLHTHDMSGTLHVEPTTFDKVTLGHLFNIWGQPLDRTPGRTNIAGQTNTPVVVYIRDGGAVRKYQGDPAAIELRSYRSIVIQLGTPLAEVPMFEMVDEIQ